ncbi:MAG: nucleotide exchange factor GrpE [Actinophytocola sp.]|uniref:nucleotide exchange factor GrpE n=1 Tax=Actinophytocola sp. TaxID=1872138 RepID=UPI00132C831E|nr:nucleotide exchange factor GrpE [Actinophytocola sp.]MPZ81005.1 nucleotide exchange factor GrpE [Actinophytocola sp.]
MVVELREGEAPALNTAESGADDEGGSPSADIEGALRQLADRIGREHERAAFRESIIDRLHEENQELRRDQLTTAMEPVRARLYQLHETLRREARRWASGEAPGVEHVAPLLDALADDVVDTLGRTGVEPLDVEVGERFDPSRHRPREAAGDADTVVEVLTMGFASGERVVRRADVAVGRAAEADPDTETI